MDRGRYAHVFPDPGHGYPGRSDHIAANESKSSPSRCPVRGTPTCGIRRAWEPGTCAKVSCVGGLISINAGWHARKDHAILFDAPDEWPSP
ncbi:hypothetical protein [Azospirillum palustre]